MKSIIFVIAFLMLMAGASFPTTALTCLVLYPIIWILIQVGE